MVLLPPRRRVLKAIAATGASWLASGSFLGSQPLKASDSKTPGLAISAFSKPFNSLSFDELSDQLAALGFAGVEATVRRGGIVEPEEVEMQLPRLVQSLSRNGLEPTVLTSDVVDADDPLSMRVLQTAAGLGVQNFRMSYVRYNTKDAIEVQLDRWRASFERLARTCQGLGIRGLYQNHAGDRYMGSALWDLDRVLGDIDPAHIGVAYDLRHAIVEGGMSWPTTWRMIQPRVGALFVKDFQWRDSAVVNVPLGEGCVPAKFFVDRAVEGFDGPVSLHVEYLDHAQPSLVPQHFKALDRDAQTLRRWWRTS